jgi:hypothetical protein
VVAVVVEVAMEMGLPWVPSVVRMAPEGAGRLRRVGPVPLEDVQVAAP